MSADLPEMARHPVGDKIARQRFMRRSVWFTVPGTYLLLGAAYAIVPPLHGLEEASARLLLAVRWLLVAVVPYAVVCIAIAAVRFSEGAHDPLSGGESERLKIQCRVMQNTLTAIATSTAGLVPAKRIGATEHSVVRIWSSARFSLVRTNR